MPLIQVRVIKDVFSNCRSLIIKLREQPFVMSGRAIPVWTAHTQSPCSGTARRTHCIDVLKKYYGPLLQAFAALQPATQAALQHYLNVLIARFNRSGDDSMVVPSEYLEVIVTRR